MEVKSRFQRSFMIFENEDAGYEAGQKPSGYIKLEVREGKGRLSVSVQNLLLLRGGNHYELYLLNTSKGIFSMVRAGTLNAGNNGHSLELDFNPLNVFNSSLGMEKLDAAAILAVNEDNRSRSIKCPLAAYKNSKTDWRQKATLFLNERQASANVSDARAGRSADTPHKPVIAAQTENRSESADTNTSGSGDDANEPEDMDKDCGTVIEAVVAEAALQRAVSVDTGADLQRNVSVETEAVLQSNVSGQTEAVDVAGEDEAISAADSNDAARNEEKKEQPAYDSVNTGCMYMNSSLCGMHVKGGDVNPCAGCRAYNSDIKAQQHKACDKPGNLFRLKEMLEGNFERSDPFNSHRSDYVWWKVTNPVNLNNILYECGIRSPLLFNPTVMMSHYKYRHLITGIYNDRHYHREYLICGIPGMHMVDKKPFNDMCRWVQLDGSRPVYGAFGYWLVYIDPSSGSFLNIQ